MKRVSTLLAVTALVAASVAAASSASAVPTSGPTAIDCSLDGRNIGSQSTARVFEYRELSSYNFLPSGPVLAVWSNGGSPQFTFPASAYNPETRRSPGIRILSEPVVSARVTSSRELTPVTVSFEPSESIISFVRSGDDDDYATLVRAFEFSEEQSVTGTMAEFEAGVTRTVRVPVRIGQRPNFRVVEARLTCRAS